MRTDLVVVQTDLNEQGRVGAASRANRQAALSKERQPKRVRIPSVGSGLAQASSFNAAGVGSPRLVTVEAGA